MTYPPQGNGSGDGSTPGYTDYSAQPGYGSQSPYGSGASGHGGYGQTGFSAQSSPLAGTSDPQIGPPSNVGWAVASILFFWPLAFVAMTRAMQVYPLWQAGRHAEAEASSATAKKLGAISLAVFGALILLYFVFIFVMVGVAASAGY